MAFVDRFISGLISEAKAEESEREYTLDRADLQTVDDGYRWLTDYCDDHGNAVWSSDGWRTRRRMVRRLFWLRWIYRQEFLARGGRP